MKKEHEELYEQAIQNIARKRIYTVREYIIGYIRYCVMFFAVCVIIVCLIGLISSCHHSMPVFIPDCINPCLHY